MIAVKKTARKKTKVYIQGILDNSKSVKLQNLSGS